MKKRNKMYFSIFMVGALMVFFLYIVGLAAYNNFVDWWPKPNGTVLFIDAISMDEAGKAKISQWLYANQLELKKRVRAVVISYEKLEDIAIEDVVFENLGKEKFAMAVVPKMELGLEAVAAFFRNENIFSPDIGKELIFMYRHAPSPEIEMPDLTGVKVIMVNCITIAGPKI